MAKTFKPLKTSKNTKDNSLVIGIIVSFLLFLAIPLTQIFNNYDKSADSMDTFEVAPLPPPSPPEDPPPPPKIEEEPPPELDTSPPPISLEQLDIALEPGTGGALSGDFALPRFDVKATDLGTNIFDINDLEKKPKGIGQPPPRYPLKAKRMGLEGFVQAEFIVDQNGKVESVIIKDSSDVIFEASTIELIELGLYFGEKDGQKVRTRVSKNSIYFTII